MLARSKNGGDLSTVGICHELIFCQEFLESDCSLIRIDLAADDIGPKFVEADGHRLDVLQDVCLEGLQRGHLVPRKPQVSLPGQGQLDVLPQAGSEAVGSQPHASAASLTRDRVSSSGESQNQHDQEGAIRCRHRLFFPG
jgi:hypothetical protein